MATTIIYNGTEIRISSKKVGTAKPWGEKWEKQHHKVTVTTDKKSVTFDFYCNDNRLKKQDLISAFECFLSDGIAYKNAEDILDFANEFGYETNSRENRERLRNTWNACKESWEEWQGFYIDPYDLANWLRDTYEI